MFGEEESEKGRRDDGPGGEEVGEVEGNIGSVRARGGLEEGVRDQRVGVMERKLRNG